GAGRDILRHAALRRELRAVADRDVVGDADLAAEHHAAADARRARNAGLGRDDAALADLDVVSDLHEVVDLRAAPDERGAERGAIDRGVRADVDIVLDDDASHLRNLVKPRAVVRVAEPVRAQHGAGMDDHAPSEPYAVAENHARMDDAVLADLDVTSDIGERA